MRLSEILKSRNLLYQCNNIDQLDHFYVNSSRKIFYLGFDITAPSLHAGHLITLQSARLLIDLGWQPIVLLGTATTLIGDPTGKEASRPMISKDTIASYMDNIRMQIVSILGNVHFVYNHEWFENIKFLPFLRDVLSHISLNSLVRQNTVARRLENNAHISVMECMYTILQGFDFFVLNKEYGCSLQLGGSDQWCNMMQGNDLVRKLSGNEVFCVTAPLLVNSNGKKMGKTESGAVWLDKNLFHTFDFWQFWRNIDDDMTGMLYKMFVSAKEYTGNINDMKIDVANNISLLCHGNDAYTLNHSTNTSDISEIHDKESFPMIEIHLNSDDCHIVDLLDMTGVFSSRSDVRRSIRNSAVKLDGVQVESENYIVNISNDMIFSLGKKRIFNIRFIKNDN